MSKKTVSIYTLGCRVNQYESCAIADALKQLGYVVNKQGKSDYYIINTCAVTAESQRKSRQLVRRYAAKGKVLVTGCAAQIDESFGDIDNVIYVCGNRNKMSVVDKIYSGNTDKEINVSSMNDASYEDMFLMGKNDLFSECRAFIKIQDGCNGKCTYCIIPKCRGKVRSREPQHILDECNLLINNGYKEIILTGIEVSAYNKIPLQELITQVAGIQGVARLRLGSLSPNIITERFMSAVSLCKSFMPHIHLSLQSCCDSVLTAMKRPYRKQDIFDKVAIIRKYIPNCIISADIIVGFPGESDEDFTETVNALKELQIFHVHSFPYSEREGTPAAEMPNSIPKSIRTHRNNVLIASCNHVKKQLLEQYHGKVMSVLVEKITDGNAVGHTEEFIEAIFINSECNVGDIVNIKIDSDDGIRLIGTLI